MRQQPNHMQHLNHQHHAHGHPHISDYSPEWGWTEASERTGCFTCRKREASPAIGGPGLPAKLPTCASATGGAAGNSPNFSTPNSSNSTSTSTNNNNAASTSSCAVSTNNVVTRSQDG